MPHTYVPERQVEWWTSQQIQRYFQDRGFSCEALPIDQGIEKHVPADFTFRSDPPVKLFGLQYKVLYTNGVDHWRLDNTQHDELTFFPWIHYGLSEVTTAADRTSALHALRLKKPSFTYSATLQPAHSFPYLRWWPFFKSLLRCENGAPVDSLDTLRDLLNPRGLDLPERFFEQVGAIFVINPEERSLLGFSRGGSDLETTA